MMMVMMMMMMVKIVNGRPAALPPVKTIYLQFLVSGHLASAFCGHDGH